MCYAESLNSIQQRTQFATSSFRHQISDALRFRNRFAQHPFICREFVDPQDAVVSCYHTVPMYRVAHKVFHYTIINKLY